MKYRSEIDGLRAIAVVPVILFHAGFDLFSGGFIGVDVFFVISGYLITTIIINEMDKGKFSLLNFYERRARRILPALFFVVLCCIPAAWFLLLPIEMKDFAQSLVAVATFSSNILFWRESGYFATAAELKPLLHTWSLAVEEQFYILFPLFLMVGWRFGKRAIVWTLIAAFAISLATAHWGAYNKQAATFFLLPTRAWELLIGSFAAFFLQHRTLVTPAWINNGLSAIGLAAILYSVFVFDEATPFPSLFALVPTVGTLLVVLFALKGTWTHTLLSLRALVSIGLMSYSLYLWHQPVFAFWRHYNVFEHTHTHMLLLSLLCVPLAYFTYRFVEAPFRGNAPWLNRRQVFGASGAFLMSLIAFGFNGHIAGGWSLRVGAPGVSFNELEHYLSGNPGISRICIEQRNIRHVIENTECQTNENPKILLWGDSYVMHLYGMLLQNQYASSIGIRQIALSQCMPNFTVGLNGSVTSAAECIEFNNQVLRHIEKYEYDYVVMSSPYNRINKEHYAVNGNSFFIRDATELETILQETAEKIERTGAEAIFVSPPPTNGEDLGRCVVENLWRGNDVAQCDYKTSDISAGRSNLYDMLRSLSTSYTFLDLTTTLCANGRCFSSIKNAPLYRDTGHFSVYGSVELGKKLDPFSEVFSE